MKPPPPREPSSSSSAGEKASSSRPGLSASKVIGPSVPKPSIKEMVDKSKRIAGQIILLKHAQGCKAISCPVSGCVATRNGLFRILKLAQSGRQLSAVQQRACLKVKKLLLHDRECRALRAQSTPRAPHFCLVCSLVDRSRMSTAISLSEHANGTGKGGARRGRGRSQSWDAGMDTLQSACMHAENEERAEEAKSLHMHAYLLSTLNKPVVRPSNRRVGTDEGSAYTGFTAGTGFGSRAGLPPRGPRRSSMGQISEAGVPIGPPDAATGSGSPPRKMNKRSRSASWGGEWATHRNTATDLTRAENGCESILEETLAETLSNLRSRSRSNSLGGSLGSLAELTTAGLSLGGAGDDGGGAEGAAATAGSGGSTVSLSLMRLADAVDQIDNRTRPRSGSEESGLTRFGFGDLVPGSSASGGVSLDVATASSIGSDLGGKSWSASRGGSAGAEGGGGSAVGEEDGRGGASEDRAERTSLEASGRMSLEEATSTGGVGGDDDATAAGGVASESGSGHHWREDGRIDASDEGTGGPTPAPVPLPPPPPPAVRSSVPAPVPVPLPVQVVPVPVAKATREPPQRLAPPPVPGDVVGFDASVDGSGTRSGFNFGLVVDKAYMAGVASSPQPLKPLTTDLPMPVFGNGVVAPTSARVAVPYVAAPPVGEDRLGVLTPSLASGAGVAPAPVVTSPAASRFQPSQPATAATAATTAAAAAAAQPQCDKMEVDEEPALQTAQA